jgi:hypothetical protein
VKCLAAGSYRLKSMRGRAPIRRTSSAASSSSAGPPWAGSGFVCDRLTLRDGSFRAAH